MVESLSEFEDTCYKFLKKTYIYIYTIIYMGPALGPAAPPRNGMGLKPTFWLHFDL